MHERLYTRAHEAFTRVLDGLRASDGVRDSAVAKAHVKLALISDALLRQQESQKRMVSPALVEAVVSNVFEGMQRLSPTARDRFPRLLELVAAYPDTQARFARMAKSVPSWMFIRWISQMMAVLDKPEAGAVVPILLDIARAYPQALYYPFRISSENLGPRGQAAIEPLGRLLSSRLLGEFVRALESLTHPEHRWKDWQEAIRTALQAGNEAKTRELWRAVYDDMFRETREGTYNKAFATTHGKVIVPLMGGPDGNKLVRMTSAQFNEAVAESNKKITAGLRPPPYMKLSEFSEWLHSYEQSDQNGADFIEIPGQYSGLVKPQPELHVRISSFEPALLVMSSLRKPKRLKIHGSDEREHPWLVKGGEDLRLDQRVQQLFSVMNAIFLQDPHCSKRQLALKTYEVVPMTNKVGIIQWLNNTQPIKELVEEQIAKDENKPTREVSILKGPAASVRADCPSSAPALTCL